MANQKQIFIDKMGGVTTPKVGRAAPVAARAVAKAATIAPPKPKVTATVPNAQVRTAQEALARNKAVQKTYGVPGAN